MPEEKPLAELSDAALFADARAPEPDPKGPDSLKDQEVAPSGDQPDPKVPPEGAAPPEGEKPPEGDKPPEGGENVPSWRLREESEARRAAEERSRALESQLREVVSAVQSLQRQQPKEQPQAPNFYEDPENAVSAIVASSLQPFAQQMQRQMLELSKMTAYSTFTQKEVDEADEAFTKAVDERSLDRADYEKVLGSANIYSAAVEWHRRQKTLAAVGTDPLAFFDKTLDARLADPAFQSVLIEKLQAKIAGAGNGASPSTVKLPPSLSRQSSAAPNRENLGDLTDAALWAHARK